jgi:hypothetical protein
MRLRLWVYIPAPDPDLLHCIYPHFRYDRTDHWIVSEEDDGKGKGWAKRRNCRFCYEKDKKELKTSTKCEKCRVALHVHCFKEFIILLLLLFGGGGGGGVLWIRLTKTSGSGS